MCQCVGKFVVYIFSVFLAFVGLIMVISGSVYQSDGRIEGVKGMTVSMIVFGLILIVVAFFGCYGTYMRKLWMLIAFAVFLSISVTIVLLSGILMLVYADKLNDHAVTELNIKFDKAQAGDMEARESFSAIEMLLKCCGVNGTSDYDKNMFVPPSCCVDPPKLPEDIKDTKVIKYTKNPAIVCPGGKLNEGGCADAQTKQLATVTVVIGVMWILGALFEGIGLMYVCFQISAIDNQVSGRIEYGSY